MTGKILLVLFSPLLLLATVCFFIAFNRLLQFVFNRFEDEVYASVSGLPKLNRKQTEKLESLLHFSNNAHDKWYKSPMSTISALFEGKELNYLDLVRLSTAADFHDYKFGEGKDSAIFKKIAKRIDVELIPLRQLIQNKKDILKQSKQQDIMTKQIFIAKMSAIAAVFSAVAALSMVSVTKAQLANTMDSCAVINSKD